MTKRPKIIINVYKYELINNKREKYDKTEDIAQSSALGRGFEPLLPSQTHTGTHSFSLRLQIAYTFAWLLPEGGIIGLTLIWKVRRGCEDCVGTNGSRWDTALKSPLYLAACATEHHPHSLESNLINLKSGSIQWIRENKTALCILIVQTFL